MTHASIEANILDEAFYARIFDDTNLVTFKRFGFSDSFDGAAKRRARSRAKAWCRAQGIPEESIIIDTRTRRVRPDIRSASEL